jgi:hypothetical protein
MGVVVACQRCGAQLRSKDEFAGRPVRCPYCHTVNQLPDRPNMAAPAEVRQVCPICGRGFEPTDQLVKGPQGVLYHRECFELERARWRANQTVRDKPFPVGEPVALAPARPQPSATTPPPRPPASPLPATEPSELAPLEWPAGLRELLDERETKSQATRGAMLPPAPRSRGRRFSPGNDAGSLLMLGFGLSLPLIGIVVIAMALLGPSSDHPSGSTSGSGPTETSAGEPGRFSAANYTAVGNTGVSLPVPAGFTANADLPGLEQPSTGASVAVVEVKTPFAELRDSITPERAARRGLEMLRSESVSIDGYSGVLVHARHATPQGRTLKWIASFGDDQRSFSIIATFPERLETELSDTLRRTVLATKCEGGKPPTPPTPPTDLGFRLDVAPGLKPAQRQGDVQTYTTDGNPLNSSGEPLCMAGFAPAQVSGAGRRLFAEQLLRNTGSLSDVKIRDSHPITVDRLDGYELEASARDANGPARLEIYQLVLFDNDRCYFVHGAVGNHLRSEYLPKFRTMARSFRRE